MSMADTELTALFLSAVTSRTKLLLAGDYRQLPSVGPGRVFRDLIESNILDTVHLTKVARQKSGSTIPLNAHRIMTERSQRKRKISKSCIFVMTTSLKKQ